MKIDKNNFWGSNDYNHPALTDAMIVEAEQTLGVKLPESLIELLRIQNGGSTKGFAFPMTRKTSWAENHVSLRELFGIVTDKSIETTQNILDTAYMTKEWGLPPKQVLLMGDGHYWITLDYRNGEVPGVRWIDVERDEDIHIADSFGKFFDGLVPRETFAG